MTSAPLHPQLIAAQRAIAAAAGGDKARTVENESIRIGAFVSTGEISESDAVDIIYCASVVHAGGLIEHFGSAGVEQGIRRGLAGRRWLFEPRKVSDDQMRQERPRSAAQVSAIDMEAFLKMEIPPRPTLLTPWLPAQGLAISTAGRWLADAEFRRDIELFQDLTAKGLFEPHRRALAKMKEMKESGQEVIPDAATLPGLFRCFVEAKFRAVVQNKGATDELNDIWAKYVVPIASELFPSDRTAITNVMEHCRKQLSAAGKLP